MFAGIITSGTAVHTLAVVMSWKWSFLISANTGPAKFLLTSALSFGVIRPIT